MHEADPRLPLARFHDLRHTAASLLINAGADPRAVAERLGHSNVMLTLNTYSHLFETRDAELTDALDATYAGRQRTTAESGGTVVSLAQKRAGLGPELSTLDIFVVIPTLRFIGRSDCGDS